jgi:hypothetical protein
MGANPFLAQEGVWRNAEEDSWVVIAGVEERAVGVSADG